MDKLKELWKRFTNTSDSTSLYDRSDIENNRIISLVSYLWILFLLPIFLARGSKFARFHANQGLVLFICTTVFGILAGVLSKIPVINIIVWLVEILFFVITVIGILNALAGRAKELPIIGGIKII